MYYPYLRGRQFELIALREYALCHGNKNNILPIIEPVKRTFNSMKLALPKLKEGDVKFSLILNPQVGDPNSPSEIITALKEELADQSIWIPAFILNNNFSLITRAIAEFGFNEVMVICSELTDSSCDEFDELIFSSNVKYILFEESRTLKRKLSNKGKELIRLDDNFNAQRQNKDYLKILEEKFTEEHLFYKEDGFNGFSDYTVLVSDFIEGGAGPYAVAIHLTYQKENKEIWIRHFVSDTNDDRSNVQGKFAEAAKKAVAFLDEKNIHNCASEELRAYYNYGNGTYPGLGMVKKICIKNHIELINDILNSIE